MCFLFTQLCIFSIFGSTQLSARFLPLCQIYWSQSSFKESNWFYFLVVGWRETDGHLHTEDICINFTFLVYSFTFWKKKVPFTLNVHDSFKQLSKTSLHLINWLIVKSHIILKTHLKCLVIMIISSNGSVGANEYKHTEGSMSSSWAVQRTWTCNTSEKMFQIDIHTRINRSMIPIKKLITEVSKNLIKFEVNSNLITYTIHT